MFNHYTNIARVLLDSLEGEETKVSALFDIDPDSLTKQVLRESDRGRGDLS